VVSDMAISLITMCFVSRRHATACSALSRFQSHSAASKPSDETVFPVVHSRAIDA
jgi:hypothetical protein